MRSDLYRNYEKYPPLMPLTTAMAEQGMRDTSISLLRKIPAAAEFVPGNYGDRYELTKYTGHRTRVIIPAMIRGRKLTSIGNGAFGTKSLFFSNSALVVRIGSGAFSFCEKLTRIRMARTSARSAPTPSGARRTWRISIFARTKS